MENHLTRKDKGSSLGDSRSVFVGVEDLGYGDIGNGQGEFLEELMRLYPQFAFREGRRFKYRPPKTIYVAYVDENFALLTLHELGHGLCKHKDYNTHIERLKIEREAWECARAVFLKHPEWAEKYHFDFDDDFVEAQLDTYRDWLHQKSICKKCGLSCFQTPDGRYHCPRCEVLLRDVPC